MGCFKTLQILLKFQLVLHKFLFHIPFAAPLGKGIALFCLWPRLMPTASFKHLWDKYFYSIVMGTPNNYYSRRSYCSHLVHKASIKSPEGGYWKRYFPLKAFKHCTNCCILKSCLPFPLSFFCFIAISVINSGMLWQTAFYCGSCVQSFWWSTFCGVFVLLTLGT